MILLILFPLLVGSGMTAPLYPALTTIGIPLLRNSSGSAEYQIEDRNISRDLEIAFNEALFVLFAIATPFIDSVVALCVIDPTLCPININGNSIAAGGPVIHAHLRNLAGRHRNLLVPFALDSEQQTNYFKFSNLYSPVMFDNGAYLNYPTPSFAISVPYLRRDQFLLAKRHNWMANLAHHPFANYYNVPDAVSDDLKNLLS
ncbi:hypothetical protein GHT06_022781 [Daphnia sinensis]|uniref:Uncharacterized protein n=1 Tax=Daphnia sinensis TaxID=1820382 RepID=A0AAD5KXR7_9CRUS|nr:hypothetical protein GHT06_022781 [Daphnia sinensis]